jgi:hypothetical protein
MDAYLVKVRNSVLTGEYREYTVLATSCGEAETKAEKVASREIGEQKTKNYTYYVELLPQLVR